MTPIPRLEISVGQATTGKVPYLYRSMICFILQGSKYVAIHDDLLRILRIISSVPSICR